MEGRDNSSEPAPSCPYRPPQTSQSNATDSRHPFIAFKHFVDDQISTLTRHFTDMSKSMQRQREEDAYRNAQEHFRWTGRDTTPDHDDLIIQRMSTDEKNEAFDFSKMLVREAARRHANTSRAKIDALYNDNGWESLEMDTFATPQLSFGGACYYMPETNANMPSTASYSRVFPASRFLSIDWFKKSCYSPINIEADLPATCWREAFEDLLETTLQGPHIKQTPTSGLRPNYPTNPQRLVAGPGLDWMLSLYCRGVLPLSPDLGRVVARDDSILEAVRQHWHVVAGSFGPESAEKEFSELVRAVATPPAPAYTTLNPALTGRQGEPLVKQIAPEPKSFTSCAHGDTNHSRSSFEGFVGKVRSGIAPSAADAQDFWHAIHEEDANRAAEMIVRWEGKGRDVRDLIEDDCIVEDYLEMDTDPALWPLCEALEKAHSELLFEQAAQLAEREALDSMRRLTIARMDKYELDRAEDMVEAARKPTTPTTPVQVKPSHTNESGILSALTTTQTTRLPDGSVTTKVVLKKRFADGREETTESVKVEHAGHETADQLTEKPLEKKRSWFWS